MIFTWGWSEIVLWTLSTAMNKFTIHFFAKCISQSFIKSHINYLDCCFVFIHSVFFYKIIIWILFFPIKYILSCIWTDNSLNKQYSHVLIELLYICICLDVFFVFFVFAYYFPSEKTTSTNIWIWNTIPSTVIWGLESLYHSWRISLFGLLASSIFISLDSTSVNSILPKNDIEISLFRWVYRPNKKLFLMLDDSFSPNCCKVTLK